MKPIHKHDCERCTFIGNVWVKIRFSQQDHIEKSRIEGDLWESCGANVGMNRYIIRYSDDGPDYSTCRAEDLPLYL